MFASKSTGIAIVAFFVTAASAAPSAAVVAPSAAVVAPSAAVVAPSAAIVAPSAAVVAPNQAIAGRAAQAPPTVTVCSGSLSPANGCVTISVVSDSCVNFTSGLSFLNKEVSNVRVPAGFVCSFYEDFGCLNGGVNHHDVAVLTGGDWSMFSVQGIAGTQNFNDLTSSFTCSPI